MGQRKRFTAAFKAKVAVEAIKGQRTAQELGSLYGVHPTQVTTWKNSWWRKLGIFTRGGIHDNEGIEQERAELYQQIGSCRWNWTGFKKIRDLTTLSERRACIEADHRRLSVSRQCELIGLSRSTLYYEPQERPRRIYA